MSAAAAAAAAESERSHDYDDAVAVYNLARLLYWEEIDHQAADVKVEATQVVVELYIQEGHNGL